MTAISEPIPADEQARRLRLAEIQAELSERLTLMHMMTLTVLDLRAKEAELKRDIGGDGERFRAITEAWETGKRAAGLVVVLRREDLASIRRAWSLDHPIPGDILDRIDAALAASGEPGEGE